MIIETEKIKNIAKKILPAVDPNAIYPWTEAVEIWGENNLLHLIVASSDYSIEVQVEAGVVEPFHATVNAAMFLNLLAQMTSDTVELSTTDTALSIKGNGSYKLPLIVGEDATILAIPKIHILNRMVEMTISTEILQSMVKYNSKELSKGIITRPVQKMYYIDEKGAITFTTGACVNQFSLEKPVKLLLSNRIIQLFKLFTEDAVLFTLGHDPLPNSQVVQTKVQFADGTIALTVVLPCDDTLLRSVPVALIRGRAEEVYPYSAVINKNAFLQAIDRMTLICSRGMKVAGTPIIGKLIFKDSAVSLSDLGGLSTEALSYTNGSISALSGQEFVAGFNLKDLRATIALCEDQYITFNFGVHGAATISRGSVINVIQESSLQIS